MKNKQIAGREVRVSTAPQRFEVRSNNDGSRTVSGYFATFDTLSSDLGGFREKIAKGAFANSLKNYPDVRCLYNHNDDLLLGRVSSGTLSVSEDEQGLRFSVTLPHVSYASDLIALMERGDVSACSFGFSVDDSEGDGDTWEVIGGVVTRTLLRVVLFEGSIIANPPAYPNTVADLRSCPANLRSHIAQRSATKTKTVDGVSLPPSSFAFVGDEDDPSTWKLPIHFPGDVAKTQSHITDALARFDQTEGIPEKQKSEVYARIVGAAKAHGITVQKESLRDLDGCDPESPDYDEDNCNQDYDEDDDDDDDDDDDADDTRSAHIALLMRRL